MTSERNWDRLIATDGIARTAKLCDRLGRVYSRLTYAQDTARICGEPAEAERIGRRLRTIAARHRVIAGCNAGLQGIVAREKREAARNSC